MTSAGRRMMEDDVTDDLYTANRLLHSGRSKLLKASRERKRAIKKDRKKRGALQRKEKKQIRKACKKAEASIAARGREATPNTPTRGRGWRKRDDSLRAALRCARNIVAGSKKDRSAIPDSDPKVNGSPVRAPLRRSGAAFFESEQSDSSVADDSVGPVN